jgi:hypothetical protein
MITPLSIAHYAHEQKHPPSKSIYTQFFGDVEASRLRSFDSFVRFGRVNPDHAENLRRRAALPLTVQMLFPYGTKPRHMEQLQEGIQTHAILKQYPQLQRDLLQALETGAPSTSLLVFKEKEKQLLNRLDKLQGFLQRGAQEETGYDELLNELTQYDVLEVLPPVLCDELITRRACHGAMQMETRLRYISKIQDPLRRAAALSSLNKTEADIPAVKNQDSRWERKRRPTLQKLLNIISKSRLKPLAMTDLTPAFLKSLEEEDPKQAEKALIAASDEETRIKLLTYLSRHGEWKVQEAAAPFITTLSDPHKVLPMLPEWYNRYSLEPALYGEIVGRLATDKEKCSAIRKATEAGDYAPALKTAGVVALTTLNDKDLMWQKLSKFAQSKDTQLHVGVLEALKSIPSSDPNKEPMIRMMVDQYKTDLSDYDEALWTLLQQDGISDDTRVHVANHLLGQRLSSTTETAANILAGMEDIGKAEDYFKTHPTFMNQWNKKPLVFALARRYIREINRLNHDFPYLQLLEDALLRSKHIDGETYSTLSSATALTTFCQTGQDGLHFVNRVMKAFGRVREQAVAHRDKLFKRYWFTGPVEWLRSIYGADVLRTLVICPPGVMKRHLNNNMVRAEDFLRTVHRVMDNNASSLPDMRRHVQDVNAAEQILDFAEGFHQVGADAEWNQILGRKHIDMRRLPIEFLKAVATFSGLSPAQIETAEKQGYFQAWDTSQVHTLASAFRRAKHIDKFKALFYAAFTGQYQSIDHNQTFDFLHDPQTDFGAVNCETRERFNKANLDYPLYLRYPRVARFTLQPVSPEAQLAEQLAGISTDLDHLMSLHHKLSESVTKELQDYDMAMRNHRLVKTDTGESPSLSEFKAFTGEVHLSMQQAEWIPYDLRDEAKAVLKRLDTVNGDGHWYKEAEALGTWPNKPQQIEIGVMRRKPGIDLFHSNRVQNCLALNTPAHWERGHVDSLVETLLHTTFQIVELKNATNHTTMGQVLVFWTENQNTHLPELIANHVSLAAGYKRNPQIRDAIRDYLQSYAQDVAGGFPAKVKMGNGGFNDFSQRELTKCTTKFRILGDTYNHRFYLDTLNKGSWDPTSLDPAHIYQAELNVF